MRVHPSTTPPHNTTDLRRNATPPITATTFCEENIIGTNTREVIDRLVSLPCMGNASRSPPGATVRDDNPTNREHHGQLFLQLPHPNPTTSPPPSNCATYCSSDVVITPPSPLYTQLMRFPTTPAHISFLRMKLPASLRAPDGKPNQSI